MSIKYVCFQNYPVKQIRPWPFGLRTNHTFRPGVLDLEGDFNKQLQETVEETPWILFLETVQPDSGMRELPSFDKESKFDHNSLTFCIRIILMTIIYTVICY